MRTVLYPASNEVYCINGEAVDCADFQMDTYCTSACDLQLLQARNNGSHFHAVSEAVPMFNIGYYIYIPLQNNSPPKAHFKYSQFFRQRLLNAAKPGLGFYADIFPFTCNLGTRKKMSAACVSFVLQSDLCWHQSTFIAFRNSNAGRLFVFPFYSV